MRIIPAIYIQNGKLVSLYKGGINAEMKSYPVNPIKLAKKFHQEGANTLFVIDLDGNQRDKIPSFRSNFPGELWWAGRIRTMQELDDCLSNGVDRVILGQSAQTIYKDALEKYGNEKIIAGLQVQHYGDAPDICETLGNSGFSEIMLKDLNAEGTLFQPNFDLMEKCVYFSNVKVYASGGVSKEHHIELLERAGVSGVIVARALYENQLDLARLVGRYEAE